MEMFWWQYLSISKYQQFLTNSKFGVKALQDTSSTMMVERMSAMAKKMELLHLIRCGPFYEAIEASSKLCIRFLSNFCKYYLNSVFGRHLFSIANDCFVNLSDLSWMLVKKQMKYFTVPLEHVWKVPVLQVLLNTRMNNLYVERFDDYVISEMINMLCNE